VYATLTPDGIFLSDSADPDPAAMRTEPGRKLRITTRFADPEQAAAARRLLMERLGTEPGNIEVTDLTVDGAVTSTENPAGGDQLRAEDMAVVP